MTARLLIALLFPFTVSAQLALVTFDGTSESPVGSVYDYGKVATGGAKDVRFRARNTGKSAVVLTTLTISGPGFTMLGALSLPYTIAPTNFLEFTVHFSAGSLGSYSANLQVNSISALLLATSVSAQLALVTFDGTSETPVGSIYDYGKVATGGGKDVRFRARNTGNSPISLTTLTVSGTGFSPTGGPSLPYAIAPANFLEFTVHFLAGPLGSYSANLQVNSISALLLATSVAAPTLNVLPACSGTNPIDFGLAQRATLRTCSFSLKNTNSQPLVISTLTVTGAAFQGPQGLNTPFTLIAGQAVTFSIGFTPPASTHYTGALTIETQTFPLAGGGFDPPLPKPSLQFDAGAMGSAQQRTLTMLLPTASPVTVSGLVTLTFQPGTSVVTDDPAVFFVTTSSRKVAFAVKQGDTQISLGGQSGAVFQTGTTSGTLTFTVSGTPIDGDPTTTLSIPPANISIETATASRRVNDLDIEVIGFDNTYTAGAMSFTFFDTQGNPIGAGAIGADFTSNFRSYFTSVLAGSSFVMRVTFPVTGNATQVGGVQVDLTNSAGVAHSGRVQFQ